MSAPPFHWQLGSQSPPPMLHRSPSRSPTHRPYQRQPSPIMRAQSPPLPPSFTQPLPVKRLALAQSVRSATPELSLPRSLSHSPLLPSRPDHSLPLATTSSQSRLAAVLAITAKRKWNFLFLVFLLLQCLIVFVMCNGSFTVSEWLSVGTKDRAPTLAHNHQPGDESLIRQLRHQLKQLTVIGHRSSDSDNIRHVSRSASSDTVRTGSGEAAVTQALLSLQSRCNNRQLVYQCNDDAIDTEYDSGDDDHSISGAHSLVHAMTLALATNRTLVVDTTHCTYTDTVADTVTDSKAFCCSHQSLFQPLTQCAVATSFIDANSGSVSAYTSAAVVIYDRQHQCVGQSRLWDTVKAAYPFGSLPISRAITGYVLRPSTLLLSRYDQSLASLLASLPSNYDIGVSKTAFPSPSPISVTVSDKRSVMSLHVSSHNASIDRHQHLPYTRWQPLSVIIDAARRASVEHGHRFLVVSGATLSQLRALRRSVSHISVMPIIVNVASTNTSTVPQWLWSRMIELLIHSRDATIHLGLHSNSLTRLVSSLASVPVIDIEGSLPYVGCYLTSSHYQSRPFTSRLTYHYHPSIQHLTAPPVPINHYYPQVVIVLVGQSDSGAKELKAFLTESQLDIAFDPYLSDAYSGMFGTLHYEVSTYAKRRQHLLSLLMSMSMAPSASPRLIYHSIRDIEEREKALSHMAQPSLLAKMIGEQNLNIELKVVAVIRDPVPVHQRRLYTSPPLHLPSYLRSDQQPLFEAKVQRDLTFALNAELQSLDVSLLRIFNYDVLFARSGSDRASDVGRLSQFLSIDENTLGVALDRYISVNMEALYPATLDLPSMEATILVDIFLPLRALSMFDRSDSKYQLQLYDEKMTQRVALLLRKTEALSMTDMATTMSEYLSQRQYHSQCQTQRLLVFDGFVHWTEATPLSTQLWDLVRTLTLALATGRVLVTPAIPNTVLAMIEPLSSCSITDANIVLSADSTKYVIDASITVANTATNAARIAVTHSHIVDFAFLASFGPYDMLVNDTVIEPVVSTRQFVRDLLSFTLRPVSTVSNTFGTNANTLNVWLPSMTVMSMDDYENIVSSMIDSHGVEHVDVYRVNTVFQANVSQSFAPLVSRTDTMGADLVKRLVGRYESVSVSERLSSTLAESFSQILSQTQSRSLTLGSMATEEGLLIASLVPFHLYYDMHGYDWLDSIVALNHHYYPLTLIGEPTTLLQSTTKKSVIRKTRYSDTIRFVFVAGIEGVGHHFLQSLFNDLRTVGLSSYRIDHTQLMADEWLAVFLLNGIIDHNLINYERFKQQAVARIKWHLDQSAHQVTAGSQPKVMIINTLRQGDSGMLSFPNGDAGDKVMQHPSFALMAKMFEDAGADFRVVTLVRNPGSSLVSTIKRGHAIGIAGAEGQFYYMSRVLASSLAIIDGETQSLDGAFSKIVNLNHLSLSSSSQSRSLAQALSQHTGINYRLLHQSLLRLTTKITVQPGNNWQLFVTEQQFILAMDQFNPSMLAPINRAFDFALHSYQFDRQSGMCLPLQSMDARPQPQNEGALVVYIMEHGGSDTLRLMIEQSTGILTDALVPWHKSTLLTPYQSLLGTWSASNRVAAKIVHTLQGSLPPAIIVTSNPLDTALSMALHAIVHNDGYSKSFPRFIEMTGPHLMTWWQSRNELFTQLLLTSLQTVATQYNAMAAYIDTVNSNPNITNKPLIVKYEELIHDHNNNGQLLKSILAKLELEPRQQSVACVMASLERLSLPAHSFHGLSAAQTPEHYPIYSGERHTIMDSLLFDSSVALVGNPDRPFFWQQLLMPHDWAEFDRQVRHAAVKLEGDDWAVYSLAVQQQLSVPLENPRGGPTMFENGKGQPAASQIPLQGTPFRRQSKDELSVENAIERARSHLRSSLVAAASNPGNGVFQNYVNDAQTRLDKLLAKLTKIQAESQSQSPDAPSPSSQSRPAIQAKQSLSDIQRQRLVEFEAKRKRDRQRVVGG